MTDEQLSKIYVAFDVPSDQIAEDSQKRTEFCARVRSETGTHLDDDAIIARLIYLRKQARLPRIRR